MANKVPPHSTNQSFRWIRKLDATEVSRGHDLAVQLGWPRESMGFAGASSAMVNLGAPWHQLDSMLAVVQRRQERSNDCVRIAMARDLAALIPPDSDN
jgi:hypothetical protein